MPHEIKPATVRSSEMEAAFSASSMRVMRSFLRSQIEEAVRFGVGDCQWVNQLRGCLVRIDAALDGEAQARESTGLRLVPPA